MANTIWGRLWESTEGDLVTIRLPRALAEELLSAISAGVDSGDGLDMDGPPEDAIDLDVGADDDDDAGVDMLLVGDDDDDMGSDDDEKEDDDEDEDDEKDEAYKKARSGGNPSGMRPGTALGESKASFGRLKGKIRSRR